MRKQLAMYLTALVFLTGAAPAPAAAPAAAPASMPTPPDPGELSLADRLVQMAQTNLAGREINDITLREAVSLFEAACKLNPYEPRFARLRAEACLSLGDREGAIESLKACCALDPMDQVAQVQLIDLYAAAMQSADAKIEYLRGLIKQDRVSPEVKAHVGGRFARELLDRGQQVEAKAAVAEALKISLLDPDVLELNDELSRRGTPQERVGAMLLLLRGNPAQPVVTARLAAELADEGLLAEAISWYTNCISLSNKMGSAAGSQAIVDYLAELYIANVVKGLDTTIDEMLSRQPSNAPVLFLKVMVARRGADKDALAKAQETVRDGLLEQLYGVYRAVAKEDPPTTKPSGELAERTGDVAAQASKIKESGNEDAKAEFASALTDLAWFQIYFMQDTKAAAPLIAALHTLAADDDVRFARLEGWALLVDKKPEEAQVKLSAIAERDPLSAMGVIQIAAADPSRKDEVKSSAQTLINDNRAGMVCALLLDGMRDYGVGVEPSEAGKAIATEMAGFPKEWFQILDKPQDFYLVSCFPRRVTHAFDEPIIATVTLQNVGPFDISIGPKGTIKPDMWFDVNVRGPQAPQNIAGAAYDRFAKRLVLRQGDTFKQDIRLDQPKLAQGLSNNPTVAYTLIFSQVVNPMTGGSGVTPGPSGLRTPLKKQIERAPFPLNNRNQALVQTALTGQAGDIKMRTLTLVATYASAYLNNKDPAAIKKGNDLVDTIAQLSADPSPPVAAWAKFLLISLKSPETRGEVVLKMVNSDYWAERLLGASALLAAGASGKEVLVKMKEDADPVVAKFAAAAVEDVLHPTTAPTTGPASQPAESPAAPLTLEAPAPSTPAPSPSPAPAVPAPVAPAPAVPAPVAPAPTVSPEPTTAPAPAPAPPPAPTEAPSPFKL